MTQNFLLNNTHLSSKDLPSESGYFIANMEFNMMYMPKFV